MEVMTTDSLNAALSFVIEKRKFPDYVMAAGAFGIGKAYMSKLMSGDKANPSDEVLKRMGIQRKVIYTAKA